MKAHLKVAGWISYLIFITMIGYGTLASIGVVKIESHYWYVFYCFGVFVIILFTVGAILQIKEDSK